MKWELVKRVHHVNTVDYMMQNKNISRYHLSERSPFALHVQRSIVIQHCIFSCDLKGSQQRQTFIYPGSYKKQSHK